MADIYPIGNFALVATAIVVFEDSTRGLTVCLQAEARLKEAQGASKGQAESTEASLKKLQAEAERARVER